VEDWTVCTYVRVQCAYVVGVSVGPSLVGRDWSPVSSNKQSPWLLLSNNRRPLSPIAAEACSPAVFTCTWYSASRLPEVRGRACAQAASASICCQFVYYCKAVSEQCAARRIVAPGVLLEREAPRDLESLHPTRMHGSVNLMPRASCESCKFVAKSRSHKGVCLIRGKRIQMSSGTRTKKCAEAALN
jgi:hypothetical protein